MGWTKNNNLEENKNTNKKNDLKESNQESAELKESNSQTLIVSQKKAYKDPNENYAIYISNIPNDIFVSENDIRSKFSK
jgi:hypothetical protein